MGLDKGGVGDGLAEVGSGAGMVGRDRGKSVIE